jgi:hypothetical protein
VSAIETQDAALAARIEVQTHTVADLDRRLGLTDTAIEDSRQTRQDQHRLGGHGSPAPGPWGAHQ